MTQREQPYCLNKTNNTGTMQACVMTITHFSSGLFVLPALLCIFLAWTLECIRFLMQMAEYFA